MVLRVLVVELEHVVVDVRDRRDGDAVEAEPLELEAGHRARRVLEEDLVDAQLDLLVRAAGEVFVDDLLGERASGSHERSVVPGRGLLRGARGRTLRPARGHRALWSAPGGRPGGRRPRHRRDRLRRRAPLTAVAAGDLDDLSVQELWPFFLIGLARAGPLADPLHRRRSRTGASRTAILIGTAPLFSALLAVSCSTSPLGPALWRARCSWSQAGWLSPANGRGRRTGACSAPCSRSSAPRSSVFATTSCAGRTEDASRRSSPRRPRCRSWPRHFRARLRARPAPRGPRSPSYESPRRRSPRRGSRSAWPTPVDRRARPRPVTVVAPLNATQSLWGVRARRRAPRQRSR